MVSIVIPVYNGERTIDRCLESIIHQTYKNIEIIVINDGSTDATREKVEWYQYDSRVKLINSSNQGVSNARNIGIQCSRGEYLIFVDSDDYIDLDTVETVMGFMKEDNLILWGFSEEGKGGKRSRIWKDKSYSVFSKADMPELMMNIFLNSPCNKLYRLDIIKKNHLEFEKNINNGEDLLFNLEYLKYVKLSGIFINRPMYHYMRENTDSLSTHKDYNLCCCLNEKILDFFENFCSYPQSKLMYVYILLYKSLLYCVDFECGHHKKYSDKERVWKRYNEKGEFEDIFRRLKECSHLSLQIKLEIFLLEHNLYSLDYLMRNFKITLRGCFSGRNE